MKEAIVSKGTRVSIIDSPIPTPGPNQVVTKIVFSGTNPKDWKLPEWLDDSKNQGDDIAGYVHEVGAGVTEFKKGDRVAAFHQMMTPGGSYAEYGLSWADSTFHLPESVSFEQAAAVPLAAMTALLGLFRMGLPEPWAAVEEGTTLPLLVWGGSTAVGSYAIQLARRANVHPIIAVAGRSQEHVKQFLDPAVGDAVVDYRSGEEAIVKAIKEALKGEKLRFVFDAWSADGSYRTAAQVVENPGGLVAVVLPGIDLSSIPPGIRSLRVSVGDVHTGAQKDKDFGYIGFRYLAKGLREDWFQPHPTQIIPGGLGGVEKALQSLKAGKASAVKYVLRIADTPGAED